MISCKRRMESSACVAVTGRASADTEESEGEGEKRVRDALFSSSPSPFYVT